MGLLDTMDDPQFRLGMGLLAAGSARSDGAGVGQRLNEVLGGMDQWKQQQAAQKRAALQEQMYNAQLQEMTQKTARERQLLEQERAKRLGFGEVFKSGLPPLMGDPSTGILPSDGVSPSIDVARGVQLGYTGPELEAFAKLKNINLEKVARTQEVEGPNGEKLIQQLDDFGRPVGKAMPGYTPAQLVSLGDRSVFAKPQAGASFTMGQSPDSKASNALGWANNNLASQRLAFDKAGGADAVKPTFNAELGGFVFKPDAANPQGKFVPIAGAPVDGKPLTDSQSKALLFGSRMAESEKAIAELSKAGVDRPGLIYRAADTVGLGKVANFTQSESQQRVEQAKDDFLNAVLRRESGAVIGADEKENANKQYFPQVGDSDAVKEQKARNRQLAISGVLAEVPASKRNSLTPKQEPTADVGSFSDPAKESRYQAWKRSQGQ